MSETKNEKTFWSSGGGLVVIAAVVIGTYLYNRGPSPSQTSSKEETYKSAYTAPSNVAQHTPDLAGQVSKIQSEGVDDTHIRTNVLAVDKTISYEMLKKNADKYAEKPWAFKGKILEITEKNGYTDARIALDDWGNKVVYVSGPIETPFVEKDQVYVVGYLAGNYSYTSQANWQITIPALAARAMLKPQDVAKYQVAVKMPTNSAASNLSTLKPFPSPAQTPMFQR